MMKPLNIRWHEYKAKKGYKLDTEMTADDWKALVGTFKEVFKKETGFDFPQDVIQTTRTGNRSRFQILEWQTRRRLSPCHRTFPMIWVLLSTSDHGLRQHGR